MGKEKFKLSKSELSKAWKDGYAKKDEFVGGFEPEDGRYMAAVTLAERGDSKASGRDQITMEYTFLDGDYKGRSTRSYDGLDRPEGIPYVMKRIQALGFEVPEDLDDLEDVLKKITRKRPQVRILIKSKDGFRNIYIDKVMDEEDEVDDNNEEQDGSESMHNETKVTKEEQSSNGTSTVNAVSTEEEEISVGMMVKCLNDDDEEIGRGEVSEIDEDNAEVIVLLDSGKKKIFSVDKLRLLPKIVTKKKLKVGK